MTGKKAGGQPGNTNALTHGFYARHFNPEEIKRLDQYADDLTHEILNLRIQVDRLTEMVKDKSAYSDADRANVALINSLSATIGNLSTRRAFMTGRISSITEAIEEAVMRHSSVWVKA